MENSGYSLEIYNLEKSYESFKLSIDRMMIRKGEFVGIVGKNGAGKSTLFQSILNVVEKDGGEIRVEGKDHDDFSAKRDIGVVFDQCPFSGVLTLRDLHRIFKNIYHDKWDGESFFRLSEKLSLPADRRIDEFSHGMKAKLNIIAALCRDPKLLILDEVTANLDPVARNEIYRIINGFAKEGDRTVLFSSHLVQELESYCDRFIIMHDGKIILNESADELSRSYTVKTVENDEKIPEDTVIVMNRRGKTDCVVKSAAVPAFEGDDGENIDLNTLLYYIQKGEFTK